jgi:hypothetical protein
MKQTNRLGKLLTCLLLLLAGYSLHAQTDSTRIRLVDSLTAEQKASHNRVLLRSELDSLLKKFGRQNETPPQEASTNTVTPTHDDDTAMWTLVAALNAVLLLILYGIYRSNKNAQHITRLLERQHHQVDKLVQQAPSGSLKEPAKADTGKAGAQKQKMATLEAKILEQTKAIEQLTAENNQLLEDVKEMDGFKTMYQELVEGITKTFKVKNYPAHGELKSEHERLLLWLETEKAFTINVYEKYVKPIHAILEANKRDPAHTPDDEKNRLTELLVSVSLLYMEYLYLRVAELSIGGKIVDRINLIKKAAAINAAHLKQLDVEHGSKALVLHLALQEKNIGPLSYPVLDETNLNRK